MTQPPESDRKFWRGRNLARRGFTLIEATMVLVLMAILLTVALPAMGPTETKRLRSAADLLASDLRLAQSLAIRDHSEYSLTLTSVGWKIEHVGYGLAPQLPVPQLGSSGSGYEIDLSRITGRTCATKGQLEGSGTATMSVTFTGTGRTAAVANTRFWLTLGNGHAARSIPVTVAAATGGVRIGGIETGTAP